MKNKEQKTLVTAMQAALIKSGHIPAVTADVPSDDVGTLDVEISVEDVQDVVKNLADGVDSVETADALEDSVIVETVTEDSRISLLKEQLLEKDEKLLETRTELQITKSELANTQASVSGLRNIAIQSLNAMQVALGKSVTDFEATSASDIVTQHTSLSAEFAKNFPVGGVAAVTPPVEDVTAERGHDWSARLAAV